MSAQVFQFLRSKWGLTIAGLAGLVLTDCGISIAAHRKRIAKVDANITSGTRPRLLTDKDDIHVDRTRLKEVIYRKMFKTQGEIGFGVIIGPSGSGKTAVIRELCNEHPTGSLYLEATNTEVPEELAKVMGLPIMGQSMLSLGLVDSIYKYRITLAKDRKVALEHVLGILRERAALYHKNTGDRVHSIIDGCDLVAKYQPNLYKCLLDQAKVLINEKAFTMILVSTEGNVMPIIENTTSSFRKARVIKIGDVSTSDAETYLRRNGFVSSKLIRDVLELIGGRLWLLRVTCCLYANTELSDDAFYQDLKEYMFEEIKRSLFRVNLRDKYVKIVLHELAQGKTRIQIYDKLLDQGLGFEQVNDIVHNLVKANCLRYSSDGELTWHSQCLKKYSQDVKLIPIV